MVYFIKKSNTRSKGLYLQIYQSYYVPGKGNRNKSYKVLGYYDDLVAQGICDPLAHFQQEVDDLNQKADKTKDIEIGDTSVTKNLGYFLLKGMFDLLAIDPIVHIMTRHMKFQYAVSDLIKTLTYAQVTNPGSKFQAVEHVIPNLYGGKTFSYDQILDGVCFLGEDYPKYIELLNYQIHKIWPRDVSTTYFDCTNYYFEIDVEDNDKKKGPSKENHQGPIISQALLLDSNQIPIGMKMFPGNQSEKPELRKMIEDVKNRYEVDGRIVQVADKGLNCGQNIYSAVKEAKDGYLFSKSVHGKNLSQSEKQWILLDNDQNKWKTVEDEQGKIQYKYKEMIDTFKYQFINEAGEKVSFEVKEKRVVTYTPSLARKQCIEIQKEIDKLSDLLTVKGITRKEIGDKTKYINIHAFDDHGVVIPVEVMLNEVKINEEFALAGYNLLVTSETNKSGKEIYEIYHGLSRIEESFRIMKSYLEARPVFLQKQESIEGHFLICYYGLTILRLLELYTFESKLSVSQIVKFIRQYNITEIGEGSFINSASKNKTHDLIKRQLGLAKLGTLHLRKKDVDNILNFEL